MMTYKKTIIAISIISMLFAATYATEEFSGGKLTVQPEMNAEAMEAINLTSFRFCDDTLLPENLKSESHLTSRPGQIQQICAMFFNNLETGMNFNIGFTEAKKNEYNAWLCDQKSTDNKFADMIREDVTAMKVYIKPHEQLYKKFNITVPKSSTGDILGCITYRIDSSYTHKTGAVFGMLFRKIAPIEIKITGDVYNFGRRDDIKLGVTTNKNGVLKVIAGILIIWIIVSIVQTTKKKEKKEKKHHKK